MQQNILRVKMIKNAGAGLQLFSKTLKVGT